MRLNAEQCKKENFIKTYLEPLLIGMGVHIVGTTYYTDCYDDEIVAVLFDNGYEVKVRVTGDSLSAIVIDVLKKIRI